MTQTSWPHGPAVPRLDAGTVDVWLAGLAAGGDGLRGLLSAEERERAARFVRAEDGSRWAHARGILRALLARYADVDPSALRFEEGAARQAGVAGDRERRRKPGLRFNLSHSGELVLIAVARDREVGVDVELPRRAVDHVAIARRVLGADAADRIEAIEDPQQRERAFLQAWVRWEAVLKCRGTGIGGAETPHDGPEPWVVDLQIEPPAAAALAVAGGPCAVRRWRWPAAAG